MPQVIETTVYTLAELAEPAKEHDYLNSDEQIDESIEANEYTFTKEGRRFG